MSWWKLWPKRVHPEELEALQQRLEAVEADDIKVDALSRRTEMLIRENHLAPAIVKALGMR